MNISKAIEALSELQKVYGDVEVVMEDHIYGYVPATVNVMLDREPYRVLIKP